MNNSLSLKTTSKEVDGIVCERCEKGIFVPAYPESEINHSFYCNHCGAQIHIDENVTVE